VYASSAATYGRGARGFTDDHAVLNDLEPLNMYGYSKHMMDLWLLNQGALDDVVGLKYFNVYGPNEWHKGRMGSMVMHMKGQIEDEGKVQLFASNDPDFADGEQCRDFIYVKDVARMSCQLMQSDIGGIFNIGGGVAVSWNQLATAVFNALDRPVNIEYVPMPEDLAHRYQSYTCAEMDKYHTTISEKGIEPVAMHSIEDGVKDYINNHLLTETYW
ncbi:MAG: NAD-dependent epimerase/dehydratase family protein, partial [Simkaniaceae bacterium]|nr:NAD-dependent epimerase/dehydratase family protein [Simkaniaceae bacterium]